MRPGRARLVRGVRCADIIGIRPSRGASGVRLSADCGTTLGIMPTGVDPGAGSARGLGEARGGPRRRAAVAP
ncbi:hypothetical protein GCM10027060_07550 [Nesterenkonia halophila]